jgi:hypothetical protein
MPGSHWVKPQTTRDIKLQKEFVTKLSNSGRLPSKKELSWLNKRTVKEINNASQRAKVLADGTRPPEVKSGSE